MARCMGRLSAIAIAFCLGSALTSLPAYAHAELVRSIPAAGSTVSSPPPALTLVFSEAIVLHFSHVQVRTADGAAVAIGKPRPGPRDGLVASLPGLRAGVYIVTWHAVSADTHRTQGRFTFTVKP